MFPPPSGSSGSDYVAQGTVGEAIQQYRLCSLFPLPWYEGMLLGHGLKTVGNVQKGLYHDQAVTLYIGEILLSQPCNKESVQCHHRNKQRKYG